MPVTVSLHRLSPGQTGIVHTLSAADPLRRRLQDLGFIPGTRVECVLRSPLGDPAAYLVRGAVIALRREDAHGVTVRWA